MTTEHDHTEQASGPRTPEPHPVLRELDVLEGTWRLEGRDLDGGAPFTGTVTRRWMPGGHFLVQETRIDGDEHGGAEYIGYDHARQTLRSMYFSAEGPGPFCSFALEYVWRIEGDDLTIWHGSEDSPARFSGRIDRRAGTVDGRWEWPGGGYRATATRLDEPG
ncbi:hypothetical protein [Geodermatophilus maliterrae]|uniref:DUF1579 domain-containing protein n=1 Tax=Geodermatophilus maliterrae TaxID=3162531 RepID=A0ABV3XH49_9ACTN